MMPIYRIQPLKILIATAVAGCIFAGCNDSGVNLSEISGSWMYCSSARGATQYTFSDNQFTEKATEFVADTQNCSGSPDIIRSNTGTFTGGAASSAAAGAKEINFGQSTGSITANTDAGASKLSSDQTCGKTDWVKGDTLTAPVSGETACLLPTSADYSIVKVDGDNLYLGEANSPNLGETSETRRATLSPAAYIRQ